MTRLVQLENGGSRAVALVEEPRLKLISGMRSVYELAQFADRCGISLIKEIHERVISKEFDYDEIYSGRSDWKLLPPIDFPEEPARCLVSGTGLTHLGSAKNRQAMHSVSDAEMNDSMKMFRWGVEGGKPAA